MRYNHSKFTPITPSIIKLMDYGAEMDLEKKLLF